MTEENISCNYPSTKRRKKDGKPLSEYFDFVVVENSKVAKCKICFEEKKKLIEIKMTAGNTTGVKRHLEKHHLKQYEEVYLIIPGSSNSQVIL